MPAFTLWLVLLVALITGVAFAANPLLDLQIAEYFYRPEVKAVVADIRPYLDAFREHNTALTVAFVLLAVCSILVKVIWPRGPMLMPARATLLIISTYAVGPLVLVNGIFKPFWPRPRPGAVVEFGGTEPFVQWWDPFGTCDSNCSLVSGEASAAFAMLAVAAVIPAPWRYPAAGVVVVYGAMIGLLRMATGGHFATDIIFSGVLTALIVWTLHGLLFRWNRTRVSEAYAENAIARLGLAIRARLAKPQIG